MTVSVDTVLPIKSIRGFSHFPNRGPRDEWELPVTPAVREFHWMPEMGPSWRLHHKWFTKITDAMPSLTEMSWSFDGDADKLRRDPLTSRDMDVDDGESIHSIGLGKNKKRHDGVDEN